METNDRYENYLLDLGLDIKEKALKAKSDLENGSLKGEEKAYNEGYLEALRNVISIMQNRAVAFDIPPNKMNLQDINPDADL